MHENHVRHARERLHILDGILTAVERRAELVDLVSASESGDHARATLIAEWGLSEVQAYAALDLQMFRLATLERGRIVEERAEIVQRLGDVSS